MGPLSGRRARNESFKHRPDLSHAHPNWKPVALPARAHVGETAECRMVAGGRPVSGSARQNVLSILYGVGPDTGGYRAPALVWAFVPHEDGERKCPNHAHVRGTAARAHVPDAFRQAVSREDCGTPARLLFGSRSSASRGGQRSL